MRPMLDPARDLAGATPEKLAKALFRRVEPLRPGTRRKPVVGNHGPSNWSSSSSAQASRIR